MRSFRRLDRQRQLLRWECASTYILLFVPQRRFDPWLRRTPATLTRLSQAADWHGLLRYCSQAADVFWVAARSLASKEPVDAL